MAIGNIKCVAFGLGEVIVKSNQDEAIRGGVNYGLNVLPIILTLMLKRVYLES